MLGGLFRADSKQRKQNNLMVFITPTIIQDEDFQPTKTDFLKTPVPSSDNVEEDWSAWDSGKSAKAMKADQAAAGGTFDESH